MPDTFNQLSAYSDNEILDSLRYGLMPSRVSAPRIMSIEADVSSPSLAVAVMRFDDGREVRQEIEPGWFVDYWEDARTVLATMPGIPQLAPLPASALQQYAEARAECADDVRRWKQSHHVNS